MAAPRPKGEEGQEVIEQGFWGVPSKTPRPLLCTVPLSVKAGA